ncbi:pyrroloquinoline quinone biosynthesis peptide chaperone PqqD [Paracoccus sp. p4-l81]|uniref:pyrroloquinoline quinone biosynthesis peptide chaperone PqqD n=1 Tax=unclassified Paracoccus (in: a-proteobacteria) TaxID=2688777 RepID=UPI0035B99319
MLSSACVPYLPRGVRLHVDAVRGQTVLLGPERTLTLDAIAEAILREVDGDRSIAQIALDLSARYGAPADQIAGDIQAMLTDLHDRWMVRCQ